MKISNWKNIKPRYENKRGRLRSIIGDRNSTTFITEYSYKNIKTQIPNLFNKLGVSEFINYLNLLYIKQGIDR